MKIVLKCVSSEKQSQIWPVPDGHRGQRQTATCTHTSQGINDKCRTSLPHLRAQPPLAPVGLSSCKVFDEDLTCQSRNPCWGVTWPELPTPTPYPHHPTLCDSAPVWFMTGWWEKTLRSGGHKGRSSKNENSSTWENERLAVDLCDTWFKFRREI